MKEMKSESFILYVYIYIYVHTYVYVYTYKQIFMYIPTHYTVNPQPQKPERSKGFELKD